MRLSGEFDGDVDQLILLAPDEPALPRAYEDLGAGDAVALALAERVLEEARVDAGVTHQQRQLIEPALLVHDWRPRPQRRR